MRIINNLAKDLTTALVDPSQGNLHLTTRAKEAIDQAMPLPDVTGDIDLEQRSAKPDIGADELMR
jgi:hypothetical protein